MPAETKWTPLGDATVRRIEQPGLTVRPLTWLATTLVSGDLAAAAAPAGVSATGVGALGLAEGDLYSVRLARDRMLIVGTREAPLVPGWNPAGFAVTPMPSAHEIVEIVGPRATEIVARATTLPIAGPSPSAAVVFAGLAGVLYAHGDAATLRLHVERGHAAFLWAWLAATVAMLPAA